MGRMRWGQRAFLLLSGSFLVLLGPAGQAEGFRVKEITTFGSHQVAVDLGGQTSATVSILASDRSGSQLVLGKAKNVATQDGFPPQQFGPRLVGNMVTLTPGSRKWANVHYDGNGYQVPVVIRAWASQGTVLNNGRLIVTDDPEGNRDKASFWFELSARNSIPTWQILLGLALWLVPGGQLGTFILWGNTSNTGSATITFDHQSGTKTIYYTYTGCTAFADYNGSFILDPRSTPAGQAIVLNIQGWCGGEGAGNWARVSQAVTVPPDFHSFATGSSYYVFGTPSYPVFAYYLDRGAKVSGPDDCGGYYTDFYPASGGGINFVISGADCDSNMWGAPGKPGTSYTSMPSLTLIAFAIPGGWEDLSGNSFNPRVSYRYSLSWTYKSLSYSPTPYIPGNASTTPVSFQLPDGTVVYGNAVQFSPNGYTDGMAIVSGSPIGIGGLPDLIIPYRNPKCTFKNNSSDKTFTVYFLDPPGTYSLSSLPGGMIPAQTSQLVPGASAVYPEGFYLVQDSSGSFVYPNSDGGGLSVTGCTVLSSFYNRATEETVIIDPGFLAY
jgi:hypothetical protein